tara:strand:- start:570 stop:881 length:312 start_codon:yes stop_codon:yes gene_type:complete
MSWSDNYDITWSKEFKDFAVYAMMRYDMAEHASEWLHDLYCWQVDESEVGLEVYEKQVSALINKSKELKVIRKWFKHLHEQTGHDYMKDLRKSMREDWGVVIE